MVVLPWAVQPAASAQLLSLVRPPQLVQLPAELELPARGQLAAELAQPAMVQLRMVVESAAEVLPPPQTEELRASAAMELPAAVYPAAIPAAVHPAAMVQLLEEEQVRVAGALPAKTLSDASVLIPIRMAQPPEAPTRVMQMRAASVELPLVGQLPVAMELMAAVLPPVKSNYLMVQLSVAVAQTLPVVRPPALMQAAAVGQAPVLTELAGAVQLPSLLLERRVAVVELQTARQTPLKGQPLSLAEVEGEVQLSVGVVKLRIAAGELLAAV